MCVCVQGVWCSRLREKLVFVISVTSMILMAYALVVVQWLLPYYYAISAPLLIGLRICLYMCVYLSVLSELSLSICMCVYFVHVVCVQSGPIKTVSFMVSIIEWLSMVT